MKVAKIQRDINKIGYSSFFVKYKMTGLVKKYEVLCFLRNKGRISKDRIYVHSNQSGKDFLYEYPVKAGAFEEIEFNFINK